MQAAWGIIRGFLRQSTAISRVRIPLTPQVRSFPMRYGGTPTSSTRQLRRITTHSSGIRTPSISNNMVSRTTIRVAIRATYHVVPPRLWSSLSVGSALQILPAAAGAVVRMWKALLAFHIRTTDCELRWCQVVQRAVWVHLVVIDSQLSMVSRASSRVRNQWSLRHSSRTGREAFDAAILH